jgi:hypothetical protein
LRREGEGDERAGAGHHRGERVGFGFFDGQRRADVEREGRGEDLASESVDRRGDGQARAVGIWQAHCINLPDVSVHLAGGRAFLRISMTFNGADATIDETKPMVIEGFAAGCTNVMGYEAETFFDLTTGKQLLHVYLPSGVPVPKVVEKGGVVKLEGAGCDQSYDLKKLPAAPSP